MLKVLDWFSYDEITIEQRNRLRNLMRRDNLVAGFRRAPSGMYCTYRGRLLLLVMDTGLAYRDVHKKPSPSYSVLEFNGIHSTDQRAVNSAHCGDSMAATISRVDCTTTQVCDDEWVP